MHRGGTCKYFPSGQRRPRRCWVPKRKDGWPRSASMAEACPPVSPPGVEDHLSDDDDQPGVGEMWCSPWLGQAWRQHLHFCPETFLNLPRPLSLYIDKLGKWIQIKSKKKCPPLSELKASLCLSPRPQKTSPVHSWWRGSDGVCWLEAKSSGLAWLSQCRPPSQNPQPLCFQVWQAQVYSQPSFCFTCISKGYVSQLGCESPEQSPSNNLI